MLGGLLLATSDDSYQCHRIHCHVTLVELASGRKWCGSTVGCCQSSESLIASRCLYELDEQKTEVGLLMDTNRILYSPVIPFLFMVSHRTCLASLSWRPCHWLRSLPSHQPSVLDHLVSRFVSSKKVRRAFISTLPGPVQSRRSDRRHMRRNSINHHRMNEIGRVADIREQSS